MIVAQIPGFAADVFRCGTEDRALDRHPPMCGVVVARGQQSLDGQAEQHDAPVVTVEVPPRHVFACLVHRHGADLEAHVLQFGPAAAQELDGRAHDQVEPVDATVERREGRTHDLAATQSAVTAVTVTATRSCGSTIGTTTRHVQKSKAWCGAASALHPLLGRSLAEMDGRLCSKVGCAREAVATLTYDYGDQMAALGPLGLEAHPNAHDLCSPHAERLSVPAGWLVVRHEALRA